MSLAPASRKGDRHKDHLIIVRVPAEMRDALLALSEREDRPVSWLARKAFAAFIDADQRAVPS